jgi:transcriptional regulatory protein AMDR
VILEHRLTFLQSNLDECDVQALKASDFEGCGPNVQIDYVMKRTELCILISKVLRERFGLRVSQEDRMAALMNADESLANWCLTLPQPLQMASSEMTLWSASLHLTYNNFLILLHRPHPKSYSQPQDYGPNDSDICSVSAITIANIFEDLRTKERIKYLWISDINALFTAMLQVSVELRFSNPILAINALRRFDSTLLSLRELAEYWVNADSILRIFEESSHIQHGIRLGKEIRNPELSPHMEGTKETNASTVGEEQASVSLGAERNQEKSDLDILAEAAHASSDQGGAATQDTQGDASLLPGLFPSNDYLSEDFLPPTDISSLGNEWREIYWQEPGISESFGDGFWGW